MVSGLLAGCGHPPGDDTGLSFIVRRFKDEGQQSTTMIWSDHLDSFGLNILIP